MITKNSQYLLKSVIDLLRKSETSLSCKEIVQQLRPNIKIAYRDMHRYLLMIRKQLIVEKKGHSMSYSIDKRKKIIIAQIIKIEL